ncbi:MAG TPA: hypothetical protein VH815_04160, partial [Acidobacteriota bacterium]
MNLLKILFFCLSFYIPFQGAEAQVKTIQSSDLYRMRSVRDAEISPDGSAIAYTVVLNPGSGRTKNQLWIVETSTGKSSQFTAENDSGSGPVWSPDGKWIAFNGEVNKKQGLYVVRPDGGDLHFLAEMKSTNSPLTYEGQSIEWSPDSKKIAFVSTTPGPETELATGDPVVITRYLYKPDYAEGETRFNDNRRRHIFMVDVASGKIEQKTSGNFEEHSIDWSPDGKEI